jgi:hypothetical protein
MDVKSVLYYRFKKFYPNKAILKELALSKKCYCLLFFKANISFSETLIFYCFPQAFNKDIFTVNIFRLLFSLPQHNASSQVEIHE